MKILITGSGGFIGKNIKKHFEGKYELFTPRSYELDLIDKDAVGEFFSQNDIDFIIHCSTTGGVRGVEDKDSTVEDNLAMVENILNAKKDSAKVILFGSGAMYDRTRPLCKVCESEIGKFVPAELYGKSKLLIAEKLKNRKDIICMNIFGCYGYDEKDNRFPSYAIHQVLNNETIVINQNVVFDYIFIEDLVNIIEYFINNIPSDNIFNTTPTESISLLEIAKTVKRIANSDVKIEIKNPIMNNAYTGSNELLLKNYPALRFTSMEQGLKKLFEYIKSYK